MDKRAKRKQRRELSFDTSNSFAVVHHPPQETTTIYKPLHEIGRDEKNTDAELKRLGLNGPQREA